MAHYRRQPQFRALGAGSAPLPSFCTLVKPASPLHGTHPGLINSTNTHSWNPSVPTSLMRASDLAQEPGQGCTPCQGSELSRRKQGPRNTHPDLLRSGRRHLREHGLRNFLSLAARATTNGDCWALPFPEASPPSKALALLCHEQILQQEHLDQKSTRETT